ncbi:RICIN domain-containing protein [Streptodolium elevatio]|uniref:Ricin B lectin domain-containing protein n=1 Tax=Streptodolium elevatio TaxID=3157996 RepID=A0ABV3DJD1_9ACTN
MTRKIVCLLAACFLTLLIPQSAHADVIPGTYKKMFTGNWNCLDAVGQTNNQNGGGVQQWECLPPEQALNQMWYAQSLGYDLYWLRSMGSGYGQRCLTTDGTSNVFLWDCQADPGYSGQQWHSLAGGSGALINQRTQTCLTLAPVSTWPGNGSAIYLAPCQFELVNGNWRAISRQQFNAV